MNWMVLALAMCFWFAETRYFGWNWSARSESELICDGIVTVLIAIAVTTGKKASA